VHRASAARKERIVTWMSRKQDCNIPPRSTDYSDEETPCRALAADLLDGWHRRRPGARAKRHIGGRRRGSGTTEPNPIAGVASGRLGAVAQSVVAAPRGTTGGFGGLPG